MRFIIMSHSNIDCLYLKHVPLSRCFSSFCRSLLKHTSMKHNSIVERRDSGATECKMVDTEGHFQTDRPLPPPPGEIC